MSSTSRSDWIVLSGMCDCPVRSWARPNASTLPKLLLVIAIVVLLALILRVSILATFVAPRPLKMLDKTKVDSARPRMVVIESALQRFQLDCGRLPDESEGGLETLLVVPADLEGKWDGPYLKASQLLDPWGNPYLYISQGQYNPGSFDLISYGADGQEGGEGVNKDVIND